MRATTTNQTTAQAMAAVTAGTACACAAFILIRHTLSLVLGVFILLAVALCGLLISLALTRRSPESEQS